MEACWLAAVVLVPIACNTHVSAAFGPFRAALVRVLAFALAGAWLVRTLDRGRFTVPSFTSLRFARHVRVLAGAAGFLLLAYVVATLASVDPRQSFWGTYLDRRGTLTFLCEFTIFAAAAIHLRTREQLDRLVDAIILPAIPICLLAIAQRLGFDALGTGTYFGRIISLAGHPIFLAAHLAMVFPFALWRWLGAARNLDGASRAFAHALHGTVVLLLLAGIFLSESRGPLLATIGAGAVFAVAVSAFRGRRAWLLASVVAAGAVIGFLAVLSLRDGPLAPLARQPVFKRFASAVPLGQETESYRTTLWAQAPRVIFGSEPFVFPDGNVDPRAGLRPWTGFGPENIRGVLTHFWTWVDPQVRIEMSLHNWFWDACFALGAPGALAQLVLAVGAVILAFRLSGLVPGRRAVAAATVVGLAIGAALVMHFGVGFLGLALAAGAAAALLLLPLLAGVFPPPARIAPPGGVPIVLAAAAALVGHLIEPSFAYPVAATSLLSWMSLALIMAHAGESTAPAPAARAPFWSLPLLPGLLLISLVFTFIVPNDRAASWWQNLAVNLTRLPASDHPSHLLALVVIPTVAIIGLLAAIAARQRGARPRRAFAVTALGAVLFAGVYAVAKAAASATIGTASQAAASLQNALAAVAGVEGLTTGFFVVLGLFIVGLGVVCSPRTESRTALSWRGLAAAIVVMPVVVIASAKCSLRFLDSDTCSAWAGLLLKNGSGEGAFEMLQRAVRKDPLNARFRMEIARDSGVIDLGSEYRPDPEMLQRVDQILREGRALSPLNDLSYGLGKLYFRWALLERVPARRAARAGEARQFYAEALRFDPKSDLIWVEAAMLEGVLFQDSRAEKEKMAAAADLVPPGTAGRWGDLYTPLSLQCAHPIIRKGYADRGIFHYQRAIEFHHKEGKPKFAPHFGKGVLHRLLNQNQEALAEFQTAIALGDPGRGWRAEEMLARTLSDLGDRDGALAHLAFAQAQAPAAAQAGLDELRLRFETR